MVSPRRGLGSSRLGPCWLPPLKSTEGTTIKTKLTHRIAFAIFFGASLLMLTVTQSAEAFFNVAHVNPVLGVSYAKVNTTTVANLVAMDAKAQEELWVK